MLVYIVVDSNLKYTELILSPMLMITKRKRKKRRNFPSSSFTFNISLCYQLKTQLSSTQTHSKWQRKTLNSCATCWMCLQFSQREVSFGYESLRIRWLAILSWILTWQKKKWKSWWRTEKKKKRKTACEPQHWMQSTFCEVETNFG